MSILNEIFAHKRQEVAAAKARLPESRLELQALAAPTPPGFLAALLDFQRPAPRLIAEVKQRSPSKGLLCPDFAPLELARVYAANGAAAISVLTDEHFFGGSLEHLQTIACAMQAGELPKTLPLLRKDFIFDRYQLLEARAAGASAALLIAAMLPEADLRNLAAEAHALGLAALVEVHTRAELDKALDCGAQIIGVNNRDLHTFKVTLETTLALLPHIPAGIPCVAESGIHSRADIDRLAEAGVSAILVGEALVTAPNRGEKVRLFAGQTLQEGA